MPTIKSSRFNRDLANRYTKLVLAYRNGDEKIFLQLIQDPNLLTFYPKKNWPILHLVCREFSKHQFAYAQHLIKAGAPVNLQADRLLTPLHCLFTTRRDPQTLRLLLDAGGDPNLTDDQGWTVLHRVGQQGNRGNVLQIVPFIQDIDARTSKQETPLTIASRNDNGAVLIALLQQGANPNVANEQGNLPLHHLARSEDSCSSFWTHLMLSKGADPSTPGEDGDTPLHTAMIYGNLSVAMVLLQHGVNRSIKNRHGETPLHQACSSSYNDYAVRLLLETTSDPTPLSVNDADLEGNTPLHWVARARPFEQEAWDLLIQAGADPTLRNLDGLAPDDEIDPEDRSIQENLRNERLLAEKCKLQENSPVPRAKKKIRRM